MDDVILNKISIIERCIKRINQEFRGHENELEFNFTKQDSIILNLQRACEASMDLAARLIRLKNLGIPQESRDVFVLLEKANLLTPDISHKLQAMVGFRNIAVHDYQKVNLEIVKSILNHNIKDFSEYIDQVKKVF